MKRMATLLCLCLQFASCSTDSYSRKVPADFVGTFEDLVPEKIGGTIPDTAFSFNCSHSGVCTTSIGGNAAATYKISAPVTNLQYVKDALKYAKEHNKVSAGSELAWQANNLRPLLSSSSDIESCVDLRDDSLPEGYMLLCKLDRNPWRKKTILLMGTLMATCGELFCRYEIQPLFEK